MRIPTSVAVKLLPIDQLSSWVLAIGAFAVALGEDPASVHDDEGRGVRVWRKRGFDRRIELHPIDVRG